MSEIVEIVNNELVLSEERVITTLEIENESTLVVAEEVSTLISEGLQGPPGVQGPKGDKGDPGGTLIERPAGIDISGHRFVVLDAQGGAIYASNDDLTHASRLVGMTTHAAVTGAPVGLQIYGEITEPSWNWNVKAPKAFRWY